MSAPPSPRLADPIAYLSGEYPRATDTFIQREVAALRALGVDIRTCSIRRTAPAHHVGAEQRAEAAGTFHVLDAAKNPLRLLGAHGRLFATAPRRWIAALALALRSGAPGIGGRLFQLFYFAEAGVLARRLQREGVVHLHNHFANSSCSVAMLASELSGIPFSFTLHGPAIFFEPRKWRLDEKIARAAFVACISHFSRSQGMIFADPAHWPKMRILHCGVEPRRYAGAARVADGRRRLLFVGRLARVKGLPMLLQALATAREGRPDLTLRLVGDGPDRSWLETRTRELGIREAVEFTGYQSQDQVAAHFAQSDVFVLPSFAEGVPVVLMEALASGVPVVASRVAGVQELVEEGESGFLVPPGDAAALAARIATLADDPALRARMGEAGRAKVAAEFDVATEAARLLSFFRAGERAAAETGPRA